MTLKEVFINDAVCASVWDSVYASINVHMWRSVLAAVYIDIVNDYNVSVHAEVPVLVYTAITNNFQIYGNCLQY